MPTFQFDPTGILPANKIVNEPHVVTGPNGVDSFFFVPVNKPFFGESLVLVSPSGQILTEGVDYQLGHHWQHASDAVGKPIYASAALIDPNAPVGTYKLQYQTIGGDYVDSAPAGATILVDGYYNLIANIGIDWSTAPATFPPTPHTHPLAELTGMQQIYDLLASIEAALLTEFNKDITMADIVDFGAVTNPLLDKMQAIADAISNSPLTTQNNLVETVNGLIAQLTALNYTVSSSIAVDVTQIEADIDALQLAVNDLQSGQNPSYRVADITARDALTGVAEGESVWVDDASADPQVTSGWALYRYIDSSWALVSKEESINISQATESQAGIAEIATQAEVDAGSDDSRIVTPLKLKNSARTYNMLHVRESYPAASSTLGVSHGAGAGTSSAWIQRVLNDVVTNSIPGASVVSNEIVLPAGQYDISVVALACNVTSTRLRLYNVTTGNEIVAGPVRTAGAGSTGFLNSEADVEVTGLTLSNTTTIRIEQMSYNNLGGAYQTLGAPFASVMDNGVDVYAEVFVKRTGAFINPNVAPTIQTIRLQQKYAQNTPGGIFPAPANTWFKRPLNSVSENSIAGASLSNDEVTLPAGVYLLNGNAVTNSENIAKLRLWNVTDNVLISLGSNNGEVQYVRGYLYLASAKTIAMQQVSTASPATTSDMGAPLNIASTEEVFAELEIIRLSDEFATTQPGLDALVFEQIVPQGTGGGSLTAFNTWVTRILNTEQKNDIVGASVNISNGQFTLPAGEYELEGQFSIYSSSNTGTRLYNVSDAIVVYNGIPISQGFGENSVVPMKVRFTLASAKTLAIQHLSTAGASAAMGNAINIAGQTNKHASVTITKLL